MNTVVSYFKSVYIEISGITWPKRRRVTVDSTIVVVGLVVGGALIALLDYGFSQIFTYLVGKVS